MKFTTLLANANGNLSPIAPRINSAILRAEKYVTDTLKVDYGINLTIAELDHFLIPEDGVGGRTYRADFILVSLGSKKNPSEDILFEIVCHEACHAARWSINPEYMTTLFDGVINEGIATVFEEIAVSANKEKQVFMKTVANRTNAENKKILALIKPQLESSDYNYNELFFDGNADLPRWAGYSAGYYLVKKYLATTGKTIDQAFADKYADFRKILS